MGNPVTRKVRVPAKGFQRARAAKRGRHGFDNLFVKPQDVGHHDRQMTEMRGENGYILECRSARVAEDLEMNQGLC